MRVPILSSAGAWCVARGVDFRKGQRKLMRYWVVYHTPSGMALPFGHPRKVDALVVLKYMSQVEGKWSRDIMGTTASKRFEEDAREAWYAAQVEIGTYIKLT